MEKRPFHCVDSSRDKYMVKSKDDWLIDYNGQHIWKTMCEKASEVYKPIQEKYINKELDIEQAHKYNSQMTEFLQAKKKVLTLMEKDTAIKNNAK